MPTTLIGNPEVPDKYRWSNLDWIAFSGLTSANGVQWSDLTDGSTTFTEETYDA